MSEAVLQQMIDALELAERTIKELDARRCKTCKHWMPGERKHDLTREPLAGGECHSGKFKEDWYTENDTVVYPYLEGAGSTWWTGPEFGCVHWRDRDATAN